MANKRQMIIDRLWIMKKAAQEVVALTCDKSNDCGTCELYNSDCGAIIEAADFDIDEE